MIVTKAATSSCRFPTQSQDSHNRLIASARGHTLKSLNHYSGVLSSIVQMRRLQYHSEPIQRQGVVDVHPRGDHIGMVNVRTCLGVAGRDQDIEPLRRFVQQRDFVYEFHQLLFVDERVAGHREGGKDWPRVLQRGVSGLS